MLEAILTIHSTSGTTATPVTKGKLSIGSSDAADVRIDDPGLSGIHATVHVEGDKIWILNGGSPNGSYVNGRPVPPVGAALADGDKISLGDYTTAWVSIINNQVGTLARTSWSKLALLRMLIIAMPIAALTVLVLYLLNGESGPQVSKTHAESRYEEDAGNTNSNVSAKETDDRPESSAAGSTSDQPPGAGAGDSQAAPLPRAAAFKLYRQMSKEEQAQFVSRQALRISQKMGNRPCDFTPGALQRIKEYVDGYASRLGRGNSARWDAGDLQSLYARATRFAPLVIRSFIKYNVSPEVGLYMAMIESEYNKCLTSSAGAKGMFQFMPGTAIEYGVPPSERCDEQKLAPAAARYFKDLIGYFGPDATSVALAIASYNRGQGNIMGDLHKVVDDGGERSFWTLVENPEKLHVKFQTENISYVPKFFATAIIGENPREFGLNIRALSSYTQDAK
ncbi:MAG TPA: FHA domain-containing protein [Blastocatellia bacterium]|jgi:soluble lytic murein transglycosylase-like protein